MRIHLSLEVWVDVFAPISRWELAGRLNEIGSRSFADTAMFWLHEYSKIKLTRLCFGGDYNFWKFPEVEMPSNVKDFESIEICAQDDEIDCSLMTTFFTNLQPLLSNVNLWCNYDSFKFDWYDKENQVPNFLNILLPLIKSINSIHFFDDSAFDLVKDKFMEKFFAAKIVSINYKIMKDKHEWAPKNDEHANEDEESEYEEDIQQKYRDIVWKPKMSILRKWLMFNGNDAIDDGIIANNEENNEANVDDQPRILYVDEIPLKICHVEMDHISKEFMQSTKPKRFIVCFTTGYMEEEERRDFEAIRHVNQTTNELLSAKCFIIRKDYHDERSCAVFHHSHPILPNGEEHEDNMFLINKMLEKMPENSRKEDKFIFGSTNRHITVYRKDRLAYDDSCWCNQLDCIVCGSWVRYLGRQQEYEIEKKKEEEAITEMLMMQQHRRKNNKKKGIIIDEMDFLCQKELRTEAFERRMKSRGKATKKKAHK